MTERFAGNTLREAKPVALQASRDNLGKYVTLRACFGLFVSISGRLHVFAPGDSIGGIYWLNGREKPFTQAQVIADQNATPALY